MMDLFVLVVKFALECVLVESIRLFMSATPPALHLFSKRTHSSTATARSERENQ